MSRNTKVLYGLLRKCKAQSKFSVNVIRESTDSLTLEANNNGNGLDSDERKEFMDCIRKTLRDTPELSTRIEVKPVAFHDTFSLYSEDSGINHYVVIKFR